MNKRFQLIICMILLTSMYSTEAMAMESAFVHGDGSSSSYFWVDANENASITFTQSEGICSELSYTHLIDGILGQKEEWGKYHILMTNDSTNQVLDWDKTFNGGNFTVYLPYSGVWCIMVIPYTVQEMTDSWTLDIFIKWTVSPSWWISTNTNCMISTQ